MLDFSDVLIHQWERGNTYKAIPESAIGDSQQSLTHRRLIRYKWRGLRYEFIKSLLLPEVIELQHVQSVRLADMTESIAVLT